MLSGLLLIDKPEGLRSTDCVNRIRRALQAYGVNGSMPPSGTSDLIRKPRAGHAGTLDSTASGLLVLLLGGATRLSDAVMTLPKVYRAALRLGRATDTCDYSGQTVFEGDASRVREADVDRALFSFLGWRMQRPPEISALKKDGLPSHKRARAGQEVALEPRPVFIRAIRRTSSLSKGCVEVEVLCGKGTYIRSLARDLGERLGCGAFVESLRRLSIGPFCVKDALSPEEAKALALRGQLPLRSPRELGPLFRRIELTQEAETRLLHGLNVYLAGAGRCAPGRDTPGCGLCVTGRGMLGFAGRVEEEGMLLLKPRANILFDVREASL
ncbi:MAG: tRNA pseudouridine(55) synthase TruB [Fretibacterium sp.]|nr:tRNA pseudouridine(55) synthase TruB [Fretibacterium sp.]